MNSHSAITEKLRQAGVRPTLHRTQLGGLLWGDGMDRHVTAEVLYNQAMAAGMRLSLATVYNTLHQFKEAGLLREVPVGASRSYFDTNLEPHGHFFYEESGHLHDVRLDSGMMAQMVQVPEGQSIAAMDVIVRLRNG
jgi:Fur family iron response transcriptional regulator